MRRTAFRFLTLLCACASIALCANAQTPPDVPVLHTTTSLVSVDVIVMDASGKPVHNLPASAFQMLEDGQKQKISHFDEHQWKYAAAPATPLPAGIFTNKRAVHDDTLNILVLDALNTPVQAQMYAVQEIKRWVQTAPDGPEIAIIKLNTGLDLVQGFTTDKRMLLDAVSQTKAVQHSILSAGGDGGEIAEIKAKFRADYTNGAYKALAHFAAMYPGKKNIIWFSGGGFPVPRSERLTDDVDPGIYFEQEMGTGQQYLVNMSDVSVYVIGSRGLETNAAFNASHGGRASLGSISAWQEEEMYREMNLLEMGDRFGGKSFINNNDLAASLQQSIELGSNYYTLAYRPTGHDLDGQEHRVHVRVGGGQYQLGYRQTYVAAARDQITNKTASKSPEQPFKPQTQLDLAMGPGSPQKDDIVYRLRFVPAGKPNETTSTLSADNTKDPKLKPSFHNFNLTFSADATNIQGAPNGAGKEHMSVEFIVTTYDAHGFAQTSVAKTMIADMVPEQIAQLKSTGHLDLTLPISVPAHGDMYIRTVVHDQVGGKIGSLEVPADMLKNLPPA